MAHASQPTILCIASFFKGNDFIREAKRQGANVVLLTREKLLDAEWAREALDDLLAIPGRVSTRSYLEAASSVAQHLRVERVVALEEYDIVTAAHIREHLCLEGIGTTSARCFQDKLAMRVKAGRLGIPQPDFVSLNNYEMTAEFMQRTGGPWMLKPRAGASTMGIKKLNHPDEVWKTISSLNVRQEFDETAAFYLLEQYVPAEVYHVDSIVENGKVLFANVGHYCAAPFQVAQFGGVNLAHTVEHKSSVEEMLLDLNQRLLNGFGFQRGVTHAEFLRYNGDDSPGQPKRLCKASKSYGSEQLYFLEIAARVGGAYTAETIEGATGVNLWREWARLEMASPSRRYSLPPVRQDYAGIAVSLARQEFPSTARFTDPEIYYRVNKPWHLGLIVRSSRYERVMELLEKYERVFRAEFTAVAPPEEKPGQYI